VKFNLKKDVTFLQFSLTYVLFLFVKRNISKELFQINELKKILLSLNEQEDLVGR